MYEEDKITKKRNRYKEGNRYYKASEDLLVIVPANKTLLELIKETKMKMSLITKYYIEDFGENEVISKDKSIVMSLFATHYANEDPHLFKLSHELSFKHNAPYRLASPKELTSLLISYPKIHKDFQFIMAPAICWIGTQGLTTFMVYREGGIGFDFEAADMFPGDRAVATVKQ